MRVSVIVPVYNKEHYIADCLRSLMRQTYQELDILVFDDGSKDDSIGVIKSLKSPMITLFGDGKNHGVSFARNRLIEAARTRIVALQDADDFSHPDRIRVQMEGMKKFSTPRIRCGKILQIQIPTAEKKWLSGKIWSAGHPHSQSRTCGTFPSEMFIKTPYVPFREDIKVKEEVTWISSMAYVWGGQINLAKRLYAKRMITGENTMSSWLQQKKHEDDYVHAIIQYRKRKGVRSPETLKAHEDAQLVKQSLVSGKFWECE